MKAVVLGEDGLAVRDVPVPRTQAQRGPGKKSPPAA